MTDAAEMILEDRLLGEERKLDLKPGSRATPVAGGLRARWL
jgi:hypothetical protein